MISEQLRDAYLAPGAHGTVTLVVLTDGGVYRVDGDGFGRAVADHPPESRATLPDALRGARVLEVRCNGADTAISLDNGGFISLFWSIDTRTGEGIRDVAFHPPSEVDAHLMEFYDALAPCGEHA